MSPNGGINDVLIMSDVSQSETGMVVSRLLSFEDVPNVFHVLVVSKALCNDHDPLQPIVCIFKDIL